MKKLLTILLVAVLALSLAACGGGSDTPEAATMTKDEMLKDATEVTMSELYDSTYNNVLKAKEDYCDKVIQVTTAVVEIQDDHAVLSNTSILDEVVLDVYLPTEELMELQVNQRVTVIGISSDIEKGTISWGGVSVNPNHFIMNQAYITQLKFEITGKLNSETSISVPKSGESGYIMDTIEFAEGIDASQYVGQTITVLGKIINRSNGFIDILDAEIAE